MGKKEIVPTPLCILEITEFLQQKSAGDSFNLNKSLAGSAWGGEVFDGRKSAAIWKHNKSGVRGGPAACPLCVTVCSR